MLFILGALAIGGMAMLEHYVKKKEFESVSPTDLAKFQKWAKQDLGIPAQLLEIPPPVPDHIVTARARLFRDSEAEYNRWDPITDNTILPRHSVVDILYTGGPLTTEQLALVTTVTAAFPPLLARAKDLVNDPEYVVNPRGYPATGGRIRGTYDFMRMCRIYAHFQVETGNAAAAVETVDLLLSFFKKDPAPGYLYSIIAANAGRDVGDVATAMICKTTDTVVLTSLLQLMNEEVNETFENGADYQLLSNSVIVRRHMKADGYISEVPVKNWDFVVVPYEQRLYLEWLEKKLPHTSSRRREVQRELEEFRSYSSNVLPKPIRHFFSKNHNEFISRRIDAMSVDMEKYLEWEGLQSQRKFWRQHLNHYNTARLQLAQRIAQLNGETVPMTPPDFTPRYLPEYPLDANTSTPLAVPAPMPAFQ